MNLIKKIIPEFFSLSHKLWIVLIKALQFLLTWAYENNPGGEWTIGEGVYRSSATQRFTGCAGPILSPGRRTERISEPDHQRKVIRSISDLKAAAAKGQKLLTKENYEIRKLYLTGETVIMEAGWTRTPAIPLGSISAGGELKAYFVQIFEFKAGRIYRQRNYDCFEPFEWCHNQ